MDKVVFYSEGPLTASVCVDKNMTPKENGLQKITPQAQIPDGRFRRIRISDKDRQIHVHAKKIQKVVCIIY